MRLLLTIIFSLLASSAFAADAPRKIDFTAPLKDHHGVVITMPAPDKGKDATKPFTLGGAVAQALLVPAQEEHRPGAAVSAGSYLEKARLAQLAIRIENAADAELTAEEIAKIKAAVGTVYPPLTVLRIVEALDPASLK